MPGTRRRGRPPHNDVLTPTEWRVVHAVQHGMSNRAIATRRGISTDASALGRKEKSMGAIKFGALAQISRTVRDIKQSEAWYGKTLGYLRVDDIRMAYDTLRARGVQFADATHMIHRHADGTEEWMAHFNDPEGRPLAIMAQVKP
jgi:hypothetical protein